MTVSTAPSPQDEEFLWTGGLQPPPRLRFPLPGPPAGSSDWPVDQSCITVGGLPSSGPVQTGIAVWLGSRDYITNQPGWEEPLVNPSDGPDPSWEVRDHETTGKGIFAKRPLQTGDIIFSERPLLVTMSYFPVMDDSPLKLIRAVDEPGVVFLRCPFSNLDPSRPFQPLNADAIIDNAVSKLPEASKQAFLALKNCRPKSGDRVADQGNIFHTNAFSLSLPGSEGDATSAIYKVTAD